MSTSAHVRALALALPETSEREARSGAQWRVRERLFVWERSLSPKEVEDLRARREEAPDGPILAARVEHLGAKEALLADRSGIYFTTPHFDGYAAILARLDAIGEQELHELIVEAWLCRAPSRLARAYLRSGGASR
ncbi:MAG: MmcQ/YjbR family DNA-binding protein [Solirubrobacteraceae bacterium]